jgi:hypothetical protein
LTKQNKGGCLDQADAEWIVIWRPIRGHNETPFRRPFPGWLIGRLGDGHPKGVFCGFFGYYKLVMSFVNMVCPTVALAYDKTE